MLRALVVALLLANAGYWAWTHGWLPAGWFPPPADDERQREPDRLSKQVRPESVLVLDERAQQESVACLQAGPFDALQWPDAEAALSRAGLAADTWQRVEVDLGGASAWLRVPRASTRLRERLQAVRDPALGSGFKVCP